MNDPQTTSHCKEILVTNMDVTRLQERGVYAYLSTVDQQNYASRRQQLDMLGSMESLTTNGWNRGNASLGWQQFDEERKNLFSRTQYQAEWETDFAHLRTYLSSEQIKEWGKCIREDVHWTGVRLFVDDESAGSSDRAVQIRYRGIPGTEAAIEIGLTNAVFTGNATKNTIKLPHDGETTLNVTLTDIRRSAIVIANTVPAGVTDRLTLSHRSEEPFQPQVDLAPVTRFAYDFDEGLHVSKMAGPGPGGWIQTIAVTPGMGFASYKVHSPISSRYALIALFTSAATRPLRVAINGKEVSHEFMGTLTNSFSLTNVTTDILEEITLVSGNNVIRFETTSAGGHTFPHFASFCLIPLPCPKAGEVLPKVIKAFNELGVSKLKKTHG